MKTIYARVTQNRDWPPRERPGVLHLTSIHSSSAEGGEWTDVTAPAAFAEFIAANPGIGHATIADSRFPQRGRPWKKFIKHDMLKLWDEAELLAALRAAKKRRMADPSYIPTVAEALRNPKEFVDGMTSVAPSAPAPPAP
jgi:hypothetical protein